MPFGDTFKALADPTRREILNLLKRRNMTAGKIVEQFQMTGATISHHLSILKHAGLIDDRKEGKYVIYEWNLSVFEEVLGWIQGLMDPNTYGVEEGEKKDEAAEQMVCRDTRHFCPDRDYGFRDGRGYERGYVDQAGDRSSDCGDWELPAQVQNAET